MHWPSDGHPPLLPFHPEHPLAELEPAMPRRAASEKATASRERAGDAAAAEVAEASKKLNVRRVGVVAGSGEDKVAVGRFGGMPGWRRTDGGGASSRAVRRGGEGALPATGGGGDGDVRAAGCAGVDQRARPLDASFLYT